MRVALLTGVAGVALGGLGGPALAHEGDYGLALVDGAVVTGLGDDENHTVTDLGTRVFGAEMSLVGANWFSDEPGVFIAPGSMPDSVGVGFVLEAALRRWDGTGAVDFSAVSPAALTMEFGPLSATTGAADGDVAGFSIAYDADSPEGFDEHFDFLLDASAGAGVYLLQMRFTVDGFADSWSVWTVFNAGLSEEAHDAAIDYVRATYVPAPGGLAFGGLVLGALGRRRR